MSKTLEKLVENWKQSGGDASAEAELQEYMHTDEYADLPYHVRNKGFITASKLKDYQRVPLFAHMRHNEGISTQWDDKDYFQLGQAFDDRITRGEEFYQERYRVVARRTDKEIEEAQNNRQVLLTNSMAATCDRMFAKAVKHPRFPKEPIKHHLLWLAFGKYPCKAELDHFDPAANIFGDFKTTANIVTLMNDIQRGVREAGTGPYDIQMAFYFNGLLEKYQQKFACELYIADKNDWCRSHVFVLTTGYLDSLQGMVNTLIQNWIDSIDTGIWPAPDLSTPEGLRAAWSDPLSDLYEKMLQAPPTII